MSSAKMQKSQKKITWVFALAILLVAASALAFSRSPASNTQSQSTAASTSQPAAPGTMPTDAIWIERMDGEKSCEHGTAQSLAEGANELKNVGVQVFDSLKGSDGKMRVQMCGTPTGKSNRYRIRKADLEKARSIGFQEASKSLN